MLLLQTCQTTFHDYWCHCLAKSHTWLFWQETLTGFKWMGNRARDLLDQGKTVLFAFEEAIGMNTHTWKCIHRYSHREEVLIDWSLWRHIMLDDDIHNVRSGGNLDCLTAHKILLPQTVAASIYHSATQWCWKHVLQSWLLPEDLHL